MFDAGAAAAGVVAADAFLALVLRLFAASSAPL